MDKQKLDEKLQAAPPGNQDRLQLLVQGTEKSRKRKDICKDDEEWRLSWAEEDSGTYLLAGEVL